MSNFNYKSGLNLIKNNKFNYLSLLICFITFIVYVIIIFVDLQKIE